MCTNGRDPSHAGHLPSQVVIKFFRAPGWYATMECRKSCGSDKTARNFSAESQHLVLIARLAESAPEPKSWALFLFRSMQSDGKPVVMLVPEHFNTIPFWHGDEGVPSRSEGDSAGHHRDGLDGTLRERRGEAVFRHIVYVLSTVAFGPIKAL